MELAGYVTRYAHTGGRGARVGSCGTGLGVGDLGTALIRIGVAEGYIGDEV